ncbi:hypothetical protein NIES4075_67540 [Tolypothrix sp. NIES-4075]|uniref:hypothetical protein n=1 Tax=Tolypothrix sp. NIES-4075 TaxID=2005459 RepID=UPI000B5C9039|nr:hypothetical protein [Tolypothrix sp. NIES-4075]GAX45733.1 hypothetical protein NIES4075_67540 [Tolypothrix sp. NIES-4075]
MDDNILNQLRNKRNRRTVEPRIDALVQQGSQSEKELELEEAPTQPTPVESVENSTATNGADTIAALTAELEQYPETKRHSAIVLEKDLDQKLTQFCRIRGITVETFLEAAWTVASEDNTYVAKITTEAKRRYDQRKRVGQLKRLITMLSNSSK